MTSIDLNADVGEGYDDESLIALVSSVNIACGGHAGDTDSMARAIEAARGSGAAIGAHPGYADRAGFGRSEATVPLPEVRRQLLEQLETLYRVADGYAAPVEHVKPHGALYNHAANDPILAMCIAEAVAEFDRGLRLVGLAGSALPAAGIELGLSVAHEGFADRAYRSDGRLVSRDVEGALVTDPDEAAKRAVAMARREPIATIDGGSLTFRTDTICLHADTPGAVAMAHRIRDELARAGIGIARL
ncbi:MAG TPA: 5-oxoprolinase subunit PxpA [Actinomycetota bacterium]|nr:5-oxoprolinase subunit PxpA [Actinomycetota bacterium]